ncbi:MbtH family protein [Streptomyces jumonjinensis]|uniref:MbtH family NRPS accessory protein n=1 Tax=Streptomyces jumonjinensis TaxID=1945 RepID=A0A646KHV2_STRJU|nr:MbtH family NRPS accessory protein [Streptomyces jumonjinensis]MQT01728.1 MbtH family NRPS accessory protein [Streptomyces jumonjinensis]
MTSETPEQWKVVVNDEEQYSIWSADREPPAGWREVGVHGAKEECLAHIERVWTDMRPRSLRQRTAAETGAR